MEHTPDLKHHLFMVWVWKSFYIRIFGVLGVSKGLLECPSFCAVSLASCVVNLHPKSDFFTHAFTKPQQCQCGGFFSTTFSILKRVSLKKHQNPHHLHFLGELLYTTKIEAMNYRFPSFISHTGNGNVTKSFLFSQCSILYWDVRGT